MSKTIGVQKWRFQNYGMVLAQFYNKFTSKKSDSKSMEGFFEFFNNFGQRAPRTVKNMVTSSFHHNYHDKNCNY